MSDKDNGVKDVSEVVAPAESPTTDHDKDFYSDIPEPKQEEESTTPDKPEAEEVEQKPEHSKKGAQARIRELNEKAKTAEAKANNLAKQVEQLTASSQMPPMEVPQIQPGQEITAEELEQRVLAKAATISHLQQQQQYHANRIQSEANEVVKTYPQLDPDSDKYDSELSESITKAGLAYVRQNPTQSLKKFVEGLMKPYERSVQKEVGNLADTVTKQAAAKALRPTSTPKGEKRFEELSLNEMEERLGKVL